jgi:xanthine dehydrogenase YagR molybdenum-binding subunit
MNDRLDILGQGLDRVDGPLKVSGHATYAADFTLEQLTYAYLVRSTVPAGRVRSIDMAGTLRMPGVLFVMTHANAPQLPDQGDAAVNPPAGRRISTLQSTEVRYNGEPIAVVIAETYEQARDAANQVRVTYAPADATLDFATAEAYKPDKSGRTPPEKDWGDYERALAESEVRVDATYTTAMEHHNPLEPHATIANWEGRKLTLWDSTQYISGVKETVAKTLGIAQDDVTVVSPFVGGGFGSKGSTWSHVVLSAMVARAVGRPVKLVLDRPQMWGPVGGRPCTRQEVVLGARRDGTILAMRHEVTSHTSQFEEYAEPSTQPTRSLYGIPNAHTVQKLVRLNVGTPTFQRAPGEATGTYAIESAMDELAWALDMDPVALRLKAYADKDPVTGKPWSSKKLRECYEDAARRFGWSTRVPRPRAMREGEWLIGYGMATATYPAHRAKAKASARLEADGTYTVRSGTQDIGTGSYTIFTQVAAEALGVPASQVRFELGDTRFPKAPVSGGSMTAASVGPAVHKACLALKEKIAAGARAPIEASAEDEPPPEDKNPHAERSFGAVFLEVRVDEALGIVRVPRVVATYSLGRVLNAKTGRSQLEGGIVWGISEALFEESFLDVRNGRYVNNNLAEYHVPVNADIGSIEVAWVDENDTAFNLLGARGIGEIGITGVAGAVANAVYHATGKRIRDLPITLDKLL